MYATASEAMEGLRHKRTKEILPSKTIARNTKLVYLDEQSIALEFHKTFIARYERDHVVIDTRDRRKPQGWFTVTTWNRIDQFTPARTSVDNGLRHIVMDPAAGWGSSQLFAHGAIVSPDGSCEIPDLTSQQSDAIIAIKKNFPARLKRYTKKIVERWRKWEDPSDCCMRAYENAGRTEETVWEHYHRHVQAKDVFIPPNIEMLVNRDKYDKFLPDALALELERKLNEELLPKFLPLAIAHIAPEFPYPQTAPRRR